jgi:DNA-binding CsgD family transcriptional regulator
MNAHSPLPVQPRVMSPAMFAPFDGYPLVCALARDMSTKLLWCNDEYARTVGKPKDQLLGTTLHDIMHADAATERIELMWDILKTGHPGAYFQVWNDRRYMTAIWRLDPAAFGCDGAFIILTRGFGEREPDVVDYDHLNVTTTPHFDKLEKLSRRELEVLYYAALGMTSEEIAKRLFRAVKTVENHLASITQKMGFKGRAELVRFATARGIVAFAEHEWIKIAANRKSSSSDAGN